jgi:ATP-dependent Clp protease, protease subunit
MHRNKILNRNQAAAGLRVSNATAEEATVLLYDVIGEDWFGGISAQSFAELLNGITAPVIHLRINSPGGIVFEARAMVTAVREHSSRIIAHVDGLAASCASWLALAASEVQISKGAFLMVHNSWGYTVGNKADHAKTIELLQKIDESIVEDYRAKSGQDFETISKWMDEETWFTAEEALAAGLVDSISGEQAEGNEWNLAGCYANIPAALAEGAPEPKQPDFEGMRRRLRLIEDTDSQRPALGGQRRCV